MSLVLLLLPFRVQLSIPGRGLPCHSLSRKPKCLASPSFCPEFLFLAAEVS
ncbi:hypothetical protein DUNSADRAFT_9066 [Dunaliella salina]|uniref:Encoded protein n=1 Tax=Dunaliella salina TaxID=3046 RepID=A0ABQ7FSP5_DUNSA|nr:hypothetical protein DUNSADRAFT_9066 [Dunaliella salina]|eukprot:KAF5825514.1 hypothetical protein DUNSADRAFT_9066 [Dunaliella salina]